MAEPGNVSASPRIEVRLASILIDTAVLAFASWLVAAALFVMSFGRTVSPKFWLPFLIPPMIYFGLEIASGSSLAKRLFRLQLLMRDGSRPTLLRRFIRSALKMSPWSIFAVALFAGDNYVNILFITFVAVLLGMVIGNLVALLLVGRSMFDLLTGTLVQSTRGIPAIGQT